MGSEEHGPPLNEESGLVQGQYAGYTVPPPAYYGGADPGGYYAADEIQPTKVEPWRSAISCRTPPSSDYPAKRSRRCSRNRTLCSRVPCVSLVVPWVLFLVIYAVTSFSLHYSAPSACWLIVVISVCLVCVGYGVTIQSYFHGKDPTWYAILSTLMLIAVVLAASLGTSNYMYNLRPYYDASNLNRYLAVDPRNTTGQQMMDAGQITFVRDATPDRSKAMGFRDRDMYCVTPITVPGDVPDSRIHDFWAVGTNCCTGAPNEFHCSEYDNKYAHSGLRVVDADKQAFYRLAVQQAESAYAITATHPIFVLWLQDPNAELDAHADEGMMYYLVGVFSHLAFQVVTVGLAIVAISKLSR